MDEGHDPYLRKEEEEEPFFFKAEVGAGESKRTRFDFGERDGELLEARLRLAGEEDCLPGEREYLRRRVPLVDVRCTTSTKACWDCS